MLIVRYFLEKVSDLSFSVLLSLAQRLLGKRSVSLSLSLTSTSSTRAAQATWPTDETNTEAGCGTGRRPLNSVIVLGLAVCLLSAQAAFSQIASGATTKGGVTSGKVQEVDEAGLLLLDNGATIDLWGLHIRDYDRFAEWLVGREVLCSILGGTSAVWLADCVLAAERSDPPIVARSITSLHLYVWLPEFGIAEHRCSKDDISIGTVRHARGLTYKCREDGQPYRAAPLSIR